MTRLCEGIESTTKISPNGRALLVVQTGPCTECAFPHRVSSTPSQKHGAVAESSPMWTIRSGDAHEHGVMRLNRAIVPRDSAVVALGELIPPSDDIESTPPYLRMVGHFWWSRLPHTEISSHLLHISSEARGCRRVVADVEHPLWRTTCIGAGVAVFLRNRPGPSIPAPSRFLRHSCGGSESIPGRAGAPLLGAYPPLLQ